MTTERGIPAITFTNDGTAIEILYRVTGDHTATIPLSVLPFDVDELYRQHGASDERAMLDALAERIEGDLENILSGGADATEAASHGYTLERTPLDGAVRQAGPVDWDTPHDWVGSLTEQQRHRLDSALRDVEQAAHEEAVLILVGEALAEEEHHSEPVAVLFETIEYSQGYQLSSTGTVLYADGSTAVEFDFGDEVDAEFPYGYRGADFALGIDLRTGEMTTDDHAKNIREQLGFPR
jgi:hypothetical protein